MPRNYQGMALPHIARPEPTGLCFSGDCACYLYWRCVVLRGLDMRIMGERAVVFRPLTERGVLSYDCNVWSTKQPFASHWRLRIDQPPKHAGGGRWARLMKSTALSSQSPAKILARPCASRALFTGRAQKTDNKDTHIIP